MFRSNLSFPLFLLFCVASVWAVGHTHHKDWCLVEPVCQLITKSCANNPFSECKHARDCADGAACMTVQRCNTNHAPCSVNSDCKSIQVVCVSDMDCPFTRCKGIGKCSHTSLLCFMDSDCSHGEVCLRLNGTCVTSDKRCFRDTDCPTYPCDMSSTLGWTDKETHGLHKREIFLLVWCIVVCVLLCSFFICWCRGGRTQPKQGRGGGNRAVQVHVTGHDDDDEDESEQDDVYKPRSAPIGTTIILGSNQRKRRTKGRVIRGAGGSHGYSDV